MAFARTDTRQRRCPSPQSPTEIRNGSPLHETRDDSAKTLLSGRSLGAWLHACRLLSFHLKSLAGAATSIGCCDWVELPIHPCLPSSPAPECVSRRPALLETLRHLCLQCFHISILRYFSSSIALTRSFLNDICTLNTSVC